MNSFSFALIFGLVAISQAQVPTLIESTLDGKVLTITNKTVPPTGPYQRLGVAALDVDNSQGFPQYWAFDVFGGDINRGQIGPVNGVVWNSLTAYLPCDDCFAYFYTYDFGQIVSNGSRLLKRIDTDSCVQNPGNGGFITEATCNETDVSQLWIINNDSITTNVNHDSIEDNSVSSEELNIGEHKSSSTSDEQSSASTSDEDN
ncbi:hypothetical protein Ocin01_08233 [Orchesella cincta]|uniref:Ricin B lectin domain-containing protein n=1 Tax=Orchesella cincta TaxID=48709 RepID=A0A1D2MZS1_ORCCI|nr:hypothetical protein Ocin01_08233 [Orchesella cincta]